MRDLACRRPRLLILLSLQVARLQGEFVWHAHSDTDELFLVLDGALLIAGGSSMLVKRARPRNLT